MKNVTKYANKFVIFGANYLKTKKFKIFLTSIEIEIAIPPRTEVNSGQLSLFPTSSVRN